MRINRPEALTNKVTKKREANLILMLDIKLIPKK